MASALQCGQARAWCRTGLSVRGGQDDVCLARSHIVRSISLQLPGRLQNGLKGPTFSTGQGLLRNRKGLIVRCAASFSESDSSRRVTHTVEPGESLYRIASLHGVTVDELLLENPQVEDISKLRPGMVLTVDDGHQRFSRQDIQKAASRGGLGDIVHSFSRGRADNVSESVGVRNSNRQSDGSLPFYQTALMALLLAGVLAGAARLFAKAEPDPAPQPEATSEQESNLEPDSTASQRGPAAPFDEAAVASLLRSSKLRIEKLQSELAAQEERWQAMLVRARADHRESELLKERVRLLEKALEKAQTAPPPARQNPGWFNRNKAQ